MMADLTEKPKMIEDLFSLLWIFAFLLGPKLEAALVKILNASCAIAGRYKLAVAEFVDIAEANTALFLL